MYILRMILSRLCAAVFLECYRRNVKFSYLSCDKISFEDIPLLYVCGNHEHVVLASIWRHMGADPRAILMVPYLVYCDK